MITAPLISKSIDLAQSKPGLSKWVSSEVPGFSTPTIRELVAYLCTPHPADSRYLRYLEVGAYCGGTACAAIAGGADCLIYEDFSQSFGRSDIREQLEANISRAQSEETAQGHRIELDLRSAFDHPPAGRDWFDIYFYDGEHSRESQAQALPLMLHALAPTFVFMVDDSNWESVWHGTADGFKTVGDRVKIVEQWKLIGKKRQDDETWHNGVALFLCQKT